MRSGFAEARFAVTVRMRFRMLLAVKPPAKLSITTGTNCFISLVAFLKNEPTGVDQSLKLRWIKCEPLSFAVHANEPGTLSDS